MIRTSSGASRKSAFAWRNDSSRLTTEPCCSAWRKHGFGSPPKRTNYPNQSARTAPSGSEIWNFRAARLRARIVRLEPAGAVVLEADVLEADVLEADVLETEICGVR